MNDWIGKTLGKVHIDSLIARGGMAEVYLGTHTTLQREVAVKILRAQFEDDSELLERFEREARVVAKLRHQNIVQVFDFDTIDNSPYIVMEYVRGPSLSQYLSVLHKNNLRVELADMGKILTGVANALQYAHDSGVIHRDIKPGNIILTSHAGRIVPGATLPRDFVPVLTDFGLVRFLNTSRQTSSGHTAGTPAYMSPEQARGETTDARTDIYSLGIVLYEMLAGDVPFDGETTVSILLKHMAAPLPPIPGLSHPLQMVLNKALAKDRSERYQTVLKFADAFNLATSAQAEQSTFKDIPSTKEPVPIPYSDPAKSLIIINSPPPAPFAKRLKPVVLGMIALALLGVIYFIKDFKSTPVTEVPPTVSQTTVATGTELPFIPLSGAQLGHTAVLHFHDGNAIMDQAVLEALAVPAPPEGSQYEAWLGNSNEYINLGILLLDTTGKGTLTYNASAGENLFANYDRVEITIKPGNPSSNEKERIAYSYILPQDGLIYLRQVLVADPETPDQTALIQALATDTALLEQNVSEMQKSLASHDQVETSKSAESIINLLVGSQNPDHKDWNGDGQTSDPGTGYGFLLNGNNLGHVQAVFAHADYIANSAGASQNMIERGSEVEACAENLAHWIPQLHTQVQQIISAKSVADMAAPVKEAVVLIGKIHNGIDIDGNANIEPRVGECGFATMYTSAYAMADMPLLPVNVFGAQTATAWTSTPAPTGPVIKVTATPTKGSGADGVIQNTPTSQLTSPPPAANTPKPPPGQIKTDKPANPTKEPKPTSTTSPGQNKTPKP
jgi:serine/threonine protein kinase